MPSHDPDQEQPVEQKADQTLAQKVEALQERLRKIGVVSDGSDDKAFTDEAWGEGSNDRSSCEVETSALFSIILAKQIFGRIIVSLRR